MDFKNLLIAVALLSPMVAFADGIITGKVVNKETGEPMDFVNIQLADANGKPLVTRIPTEEE